MVGLTDAKKTRIQNVLFQSIQFFIHCPWCQYTVFVQILPHLFNNNKVLFVFQWCFGSALFHLDTTSECTHPYFDLDTTGGCTHQYFEWFDILVKIAFDNWWQHSAHYEGSCSQSLYVVDKCHLILDTGPFTSCSDQILDCLFNWSSLLVIPGPLLSLCMAISLLIVKYKNEHCVPLSVKPSRIHNNPFHLDILGGVHWLQMFGHLH